MNIKDLDYYIQDLLIRGTAIYDEDGNWIPFELFSGNADYLYEPQQKGYYGC